MPFVKFEKGPYKYDISVYKNGVIFITNQFANIFSLYKYSFVEIYYDLENYKLGFIFVESRTVGSYKLTIRNKKSNGISFSGMKILNKIGIIVEKIIYPSISFDKEKNMFIVDLKDLKNNKRF